MYKEYGIVEYFWQFFRIGVFYGIYQVVVLVFVDRQLLTDYQKSQTFAAAVVAWFLYDIYVQVFGYLMLIIYGCQTLEPIDSMFMLDDEKNVSNIMGCAYFEKFEFEDMRTYLEAKTSQIDKCRTKLVKRYGLWWNKEMDQDEWNSKKDSVF
jgi:hypothetical protein